MNTKLLARPLIIFLLLPVAGFSFGIGIEAYRLNQTLQEYKEIQLQQNLSIVEI